MARDSIEYDYTVSKIKTQMPLELKKEKSDYIIDSSNGFEDTLNQINKIIKTLKEAI